MALNTELIGKDDGNTVMEKLVPFNSFEKFADFCALNPTSLSDFVKCVFNMHKFSIYHHDINMKNICFSNMGVYGNFAGFSGKWEIGLELVFSVLGAVIF